ncbi:MAG: transaldolase family protein, partial [Halanaerobium sp.]
NNLKTKILAASFKNVNQIHKIILSGAQSFTAGPDLMDKLLEHSGTSSSVEQFIDDWESVYGKDKLSFDV